MGEKIRDLADKILTHKKLYYAGSPAISDSDYDRLEDELRALDPDHPVLSYVGSEPGQSNTKVPHQIPMLSLQKTYKEDELLSWRKSHELVGTWKVDGNSLALVYQAGNLTQAKTRGNGRVGEDVSAKVLWVSDVKRSIPLDEPLEIRGELYCSETQFLSLGKEMGELGLEHPSNPRNIVAGVLGRKAHPYLARYFSFLAFDIVSLSPLPFRWEHEKFAWLQKNGFQVPDPRILKTDKDVRTYLTQVKDLMASSEVGLDGAVFSYDDLASHEELGMTSHHPRAKMSFKWQGATSVATVTKVIWNTSRLGIVTPVAVIEPTVLSGATITNVTLHNAEHVRQYNLKKGDRIELVRSGEVIPKFLEVKEAGPGEYQWPDHCPSCRQPLDFDGVRLKCPNETGCPAQQIGVILNWIKAAEIDDLSEKRLSALMEMGLVKKAADLYTITEEQMLRAPLTKEKMARKLVANIQASKNLPLVQFLHGLGIEGAGRTTWERILSCHPSLEALMGITEEDLIQIDGFAQISAEQVVQGLKKRRAMIEELEAVGVMPTPPSRESSADGVLAGQTFVITGSLTRPRKQIETQIKSLGGGVSSAVSKKTTALITNDRDSTSSKMKKALELGIPVWSEQDLERKLPEE